MIARPGTAALRTAATYIALLLGANLAWETAHVPLYTLWAEASAGTLARAVLHCTAGDAVLGAAMLATALMLTRSWGWPSEGFGRVLVATTLLGMVTTVVIEWLSVEFWGRWAYSAAMPLLPPLGTGLTPLLQWLLLPPLCLWTARRWATRRPSPHDALGRGASR